MYHDPFLFDVSACATDAKSATARARIYCSCFSARSPRGGIFYVWEELLWPHSCFEEGLLHFYRRPHTSCRSKAALIDENLKLSQLLDLLPEKN